VYVGLEENVDDQLDAEGHKSRSAGHISQGKEDDEQYSLAKAQVDWECATT